MKLRNKKTGEVFNFVIKTEQDYTASYFVLKTGSGGWEDGLTYGTLEELHEGWEDAEDTNVPSMPLIKDEKIRKAVRAWADVNGTSRCVCKDETHCITFETERGMFISFEDADPIPPEGNFTITELCGEEEE